MAKHELALDDLRFRADFEACTITPSAFDHRGHIRLAYVYLVNNDVETALTMVRDALQAFIEHHGIDASKYHETLTRAWVLAVRHFMEISSSSASSEAFIKNNPTLLDSKIMMTHYSAELLFADEARARFVEPNLDEIPRHES